MTKRRILLVGATGSAMETATGQTLRRLFEHARFATPLEVVYSGGPQDAVIIPAGVAPLDKQLRRLRIPGRARVRASSATPRGLNDAIKVGKTSLKASLVRHARAAADLSPVRLPRDLRARLEDYAPDAVYSLLGNVRTMKLALAVSREFNIPIVPHFMDDWPETLYPNHELFGLARRVARNELARVLERSPAIVCIGDQMAVEYGRRYGRRIYVAAFGAEQQWTDSYTVRVGSGMRRLVYAGGLHLGRQQVLEWIAEALEGTDWILDVYASSRGASTRHLRYNDAVPVEAVPAVLADADALLLVESLEPAIADYTRLSVSTKTAQYVAANRPAVLVGPEGQATLGVLEDHLRTSVRFTALAPEFRAMLLGFLGGAHLTDQPATLMPTALTAPAMGAALSDAVDHAIEEWPLTERASR